MTDDTHKDDLDTDNSVDTSIPDQVSISDLPNQESGHKDDPQSVPPALHDSGAASGHAPDLETDDDVDELGNEAGINYSEDEELGIDQKINVSTETTPPEEDQPY